MRALIWCALPALVAVINMSRGLRKYGAGVKQQYGAGLAEQASGIFLGHLSRRITDETYYLYQLYLPERQGTLGRHFSFKQITPLQRYFTICVPCPDYPSLRSKHLFARHCVEAGFRHFPWSRSSREEFMFPRTPSLSRSVICFPSHRSCTADTEPIYGRIKAPARGRTLRRASCLTERPWSAGWRWTQTQVTSWCKGECRTMPR